MSALSKSDFSWFLERFTKYLIAISITSTILRKSVMKFEPKYKRPFANFAKKQHKPFQAVIEDEVSAVCDNPQIGEAKVGDLTGIRVHKLPFRKQEYLMAYSDPEIAPMEAGIEHENPERLPIMFFLIGPHENFYDDLKAYLKANGWYT
jgi:hypothetical protein